MGAFGFATQSGVVSSQIFASGGNGLEFYNTTDQVTNYEKYRFYWTGNTFAIDAFAGGTGTSRSMQITAPNLTMFPGSSGAVAVQITNGSGGQFRVRDSRNGTLWAWSGSGALTVYSTTTAAGTTGARTINRPAGTVNFAAGAGSLVVTNSLVTTASYVFCTVRTADSTALIKNVVPAAGSFTINLNANATAETSVAFWVIN